MYHMREAIWPLIKSKDMESIGLRNCWIEEFEPRIFGVQSLFDNEHEDGCFSRDEKGPTSGLSCECGGSYAKMTLGG